MDPAGTLRHSLGRHSPRARKVAAEFFSVLGETLEFEQFEPREFVAQGDTVVVLGYERCIVKPTGRTFEQEWAHVYTLRNGKIARGRFLEDTAAQVVAFGAACAQLGSKAPV